MSLINYYLPAAFNMSKSFPAKKISKAARPAAPKKPAAHAPALNAKAFTAALLKLQSPKHKESIQRYFKSGEGSYGAGDKFIGVKMGQLFGLAKIFLDMPVSEIEKLLESDIHESRAGAVSIMDKASRSKKTTDARRKSLFDLYMRRHDRINNWDLVDLGCLHMTGNYLLDKPHSILYKMARSKNIWERRTAIVTTCSFIRQGDTTDALAIAEILMCDKEDLIHKATGWMLRFAGDKEPKKLLQLLDRYAATMPRTMLRYSIEKLDKKKKDHYMAMKKNAG
jgi:3-methyladenine DNA glycosylase AlkD